MKKMISHLQKYMPSSLANFLPHKKASKQPTKAFKKRYKTPYLLSSMLLLLLSMHSLEASKKGGKKITFTTNQENLFIELNNSKDKENNEKIIELLEKEDNLNKKDKNGNAFLHFAVHNNKLDIVNALLKKGANPNLQHNKKNTALHFAVYNNKLDIVNALLNKGANPDLQDNKKNTALHFAVHNNKLDIVNALLNKGAKPNLKGEKNNTALHLAVKERHIEVFKTLLDNGANLLIQNKNGNSPLDFVMGMVKKEELAVWSPYINAIIEKKGIDNKYNNNTLLYFSVNENKLELFNFLLDKRADFTIENQQRKLALELVIETEKIEFIKSFIEKKSVNAKVDKSGSSLIHLAALHGNQKIIDLLLEDSRLEINARNTDKEDTFLHVSARCDDNSTILADFVKNPNKYKDADITLLNKHNFSVYDSIDDSNNKKELKENLRTMLNEALLKAKEKGDIKKWLDAGADINAQDDNGDTALHRVAKANKLDILLDLLKRKGIKLGLKNKEDKTIHNLISGKDNFKEARNEISKKFNLFTTVEKANLEEIKESLDTGADVNLQDKDGNTVLHFEVKKNSHKIAFLLLEYGADPTIENNKGGHAFYPIEYKIKEYAEQTIGEKNTPLLHLVAKRNQSKTVAFLLENKVEVNATNDEGFTAFHFAAQNNDTGITKSNSSVIDILLKAPGADPNIQADGDTALHIATREGNIDVIKALYASDNVGKFIKNKKGHIPLQVAVEQNNTKVLKQVLQLHLNNPTKDYLDKATTNDVKKELLKAKITSDKEIQDILKKILGSDGGGSNGKSFWSIFIVLVVVASVIAIYHFFLRDFLKKRAKKKRSRRTSRRSLRS